MKKLKEFDIFLEKKPGPDGYMTGLSDKDEEEKEDQMKKQGAMDDDDPSAYKEMPGDKKARKEGKVKKSKFTTAYHKKFKKNEMKNLQELDSFIDDMKATKETQRIEDIKNTKLNTKLKTIDEFLSEAFVGPFVFNNKMSDEELKDMYDAALDGYANYQRGFEHPKSKYKQAYQEIEKILKKRGVSVDEAVELVHVYKDGELYGTGELVKGKDKKIKGKKHQLIRFDGSTEDYYPAEDVKLVESINEDYDKMLDRRYGRSRDYTDIEVKDMHFQTDADELEKMKLAYGYRLGGMTGREKIEDAEYELRRYRKTIKYGNGKEVGVFLPGSYDAATSTLGDGPHKSARPKVKWNQRKYDQWIEDVASNDGWKHAADMAQNANNEPGLIDWVKRNNRGDDPLQRIQWDIEAMAESVNEKKELPKEITKHRDIPSWAKYVAQQSDGEWTWYEETPTMIKFRSGGGAWKQDGNQTYTGVKTDGKDWDKMPTYYYVKGGKITESSELHESFKLDENFTSKLTGIARRAKDVKDFVKMVFKHEKFKTFDTPKTQPDTYENFLKFIKNHYEMVQQYESKESNMKKLQTLESFVNEKKDQTNDQSPMGDDGMETGIKNKAKESGVPVGLLRIIMKRGLAAWKSGHRPGATQAQWGYARVNSFLTKQDGTWGGADSDIAKKVRDGGHDKEL